MVGERSPKPSMWVRFLPLVQINTIMFKKIINNCIEYCKVCYDELAHKTTWPTRQQLTHSAVVVLSASLVIALVVFAMDSVFKFVMTTIYPN